jgi:hypothetical protein
VRKQDIVIAKNHLTKDEIDTLNRLVVIFLETAELRAKSRKLSKPTSKTKQISKIWKPRSDGDRKNERSCMTACNVPCAPLWPTEGISKKVSGSL